MVLDLSIPFGDAVSCEVVDGVLDIWSGTHVDWNLLIISFCGSSDRREVAYSLDVVSDFLGDELGDVDILGVLDTDLISIVGGNLR